MTKTPGNILVIKLSALGDFIQALGAMKAIHNYHSLDKITLLTTAPYSQMGRDCGYFHEVVIDKRPGAFNFVEWRRLRKFFNQGMFDRVYDLQKKDRTQLYFNLFDPKPEWVGIAKGASHRNTNPSHGTGSAFEGHKQTLALAGIKDVEPDPLDWMISDINRFDLPQNYALFIPGSSARHPEKRWPSGHFARLADIVIAANITPVIIGTVEEKEISRKIIQSLESDSGKLIDLTGQTRLYDIAGLARGARYVIGNDTGPVHIASLTGAFVIALYNTRASDPEKHKPLGPEVEILAKECMKDITAENIWETITRKKDK